MKRKTSLKRRNKLQYDLTGQKFGKLTILHENGLDKWHQIIWNCLCECGNFHGVITAKLISGHTKSCGCGMGTQLSNGEAAFNILFGRYKAAAVRRGYIFELTKKQFERLTSSNCYYCGAIPEQICSNKSSKQTGYYTYNGVDRVNNAKGYMVNNCVPCCGRCNHIKMDLTQEEFLQHIKKIYLRRVQDA